MLKTKFISLSISLVTMAIISSFIFSFNTIAYAWENHQIQSNSMSVWHKPIVNYNGNKNITVYSSPLCGCCGDWIAHLEKNGFEVTDIKTDNIEAIKQQNNLPSQLASCHTGIIDGYVMEGHIPADDIKSFLSQTHTMKGLSVPGMVIGSPGMESGNTKQPFDVMAFNEKEIKVFNRYKDY